MFIIDKQFLGANISRTIRFTEKIYEELNAISNKENISFNMLVLQCCNYALENMDKENSDMKENNH